MIKSYPEGEILVSPLGPRMVALMESKEGDADPDTFNIKEWLALGGTKEEFLMLDVDGDKLLDLDELSSKHSWTTVALKCGTEEQMPIGVEPGAHHPSKLCSVRFYGKSELDVIVKSVSVIKVARNIASLLQRDEGDRHLDRYWQDIITCWGNMIAHLNNSTGLEDPFTQHGDRTAWGIPKRAEQEVTAQHGAIELTIDVLKLILSKPLDEGEQHISVKAILILFKFLQQLQKDCPLNSIALEPHKQFLYEHLNSKYQVTMFIYQDVVMMIVLQVADCVGELLMNNQDSLKDAVNAEFLQFVFDAMREQHLTSLCGGRFMSILKICCSCYGEPHCPNQNKVLVHCIVPLIAVDQENLLSRIRISQTGEVEISAPTTQKSGCSKRYDWSTTRWIPVSQFQVSRQLSDYL